MTTKKPTTPPVGPSGVSGAPNSAELNPVRAEALTHALAFARDRGAVSSRHPGTVDILAAAEVFERYPTTGETGLEECAQ